VRIRAAVPADAARFALTGKATFLESYAGLLPVTDILAHGERQHAESVYAAWLADDRWGCWLAEAETGGAPVGYLVVGPTDLPMQGLDARDLEIKRIYLLHRFQNQGLGRAMMQAATDWARARGARRLLLGVYTRNEPALAFYARMGFDRVGERQFHVGENEYHDHILGMTL
jgi:GNAT superfamily N-acetyltransferase